MSTFDTPQPISVSLEVVVGDVTIAASERGDTVVEVRPADPAEKADVTAARQTLVECAGGLLTVKAPKSWRQWTPWGEYGSIAVRIELPSGSQVRGATSVGSLRCSGSIGECHFRTGVGDIQLEEAGPLELKSGTGKVNVDRAIGRSQITTAGAVRIGRAEGPLVVRNRNGDTWLGEVAGETEVTAANGAIAIEAAHTSVSAKSANGDVRVGEVAGGTVVAQSSLGAVEVGVRDGVAAWLDLETKFGTVENELAAAQRPGPGEEAVEIRARTSMGRIAIHRS
ncbi:MAG: DUF4097 family beta strand repeat-containing protein [Thermoleophilia bacterium]|jgi:hypothetical protein